MRRLLRRHAIKQATVDAVLVNLVGAHGPMTCDALAEEMRVGRGVVIAAADRMAEQGYVTRSDTGHIVTATPQALELLAEGSKKLAAEGRSA